MTTEEVKEETTHNNRVSLVFKHPEILTEFNNNIIKKYGTITGYRIKVIETLLSNYNEHKTLEDKKPLYVEENRKLTEENNRLTVENNNYEKQVNTLQHLTEKLKEYDSLKEENHRLQETIKSNTVTIDHLKENLQKEETKNQDILKISEDLKKETSNRIIELKQILTGKEEEIKEYVNKVEDYNTIQEDNIKLQETVHHNTLTIADKDKKIKDLQEEIRELKTEISTINSEHKEEIKEYKQDIKDYKQELKSKDNDYKQASGYALKLHEEVTTIKNLGLFDRVFKRYPEEENTIKELKP